MTSEVFFAGFLWQTFPPSVPASAAAGCRWDFKIDNRMFDFHCTFFSSLVLWKELNKVEKLKMETKNKNIKTFAEHLDKRHGKIDTEARTNFEIKAKSFAIGS
ncbi:hypothetical protein [Kaistella jeonii]|uniref:hypothetical protein n=1 Tax=Kaistella jeonii TaxID=266749 RepID=UPI0008E1E369|nr:hypothetical protein [Kaistella jeonii]SFB69131.1 hypothetical protein SAMN05421876_101105 [Kaistella jeonii]VEI94708.1 Uncharacterised protein [Kaistella jeonii]